MPETRKFPLHVHISTLFLVLILLVGGVIAGIGFKLSRDMLQATANDMIGRIGVEVRNEIDALLKPAELAISVVGHTPLTEDGGFDARLRRIPLLRAALDGSPALASLYVGYGDGDFFFLRRVADDDERRKFDAPANTHYMAQAIDHAGTQSVGRYLFLDERLQRLRSDDKPDYPKNYDPRKRGWYQDARTAGAAIKTAPYLFFSNRKVGMTLAAPCPDGRDCVVGADILLETLADNLRQKKLTPGTELALVNAQGQVLAHEHAERLVSVTEGVDAKPSLTHLANFGRPILAAVAKRFDFATGSGQINENLTTADDDWQLNITPVGLSGMPPLYLVVAIPERELLAAALQLRFVSIFVTALVILLSIPLTWYFANGISAPIRRLGQQARRIANFDFSAQEKGHTLVSEVDELSVAMAAMRSTIRRFLSISHAVNSESNFDRLMPMLLKETMEAAEAEAGILYLADSDGLLPMCVMTVGGAESSLPMLPVPLTDAGPLLGTALVSGMPHGAAISAEDIAATGVDELVSSAATPQGIAVPLFNRQHHLVGAMLLVRSTPIDEAQRAFVSNLAESAASSLETRELLKAQKELFEAFIKLIAGAIDAKSPYTGGHCERVPELTKMLAQAACDAQDGPFKDFQLGDDEWEAVHIAAWLHDCGKVTTPEYVVDKATKLETIYDRIHEIRMRFEVLKRDAHIAYWQGLAEGGEMSALARRRDAELAQLDDDFAFIAACNEGGEFMAPEKLERLGQIAQRTWLRTLDDRIGISYEEHQRKARTPPEPLPRAEPLLADKPEHVFERQPKDRMPEKNKWGFRMKVPEHLYNKGELYNLSVGRGTLAEEDRYKINEHIVQTVIMLSALPFPKHLKKIPEIAGGHHEKMDGTGYPKRLTKDDMSPLARMMAIADIFEALTAVDRPYKKGKTLSEAIKIMSFMKKEQHIDPELFELFLRSGVHRSYAERFMKPEQIDEVDIAAYLSPATPA